MPQRPLAAIRSPSPRPPEVDLEPIGIGAPLIDRHFLELLQNQPFAKPLMCRGRLALRFEDALKRHDIEVFGPERGKQALEACKQLRPALAQTVALATQLTHERTAILRRKGPDEGHPGKVARGLACCARTAA